MNEHLNLSTTNIVISIVNSVVLIVFAFAAGIMLVAFQTYFTRRHYKKLIEKATKSGGLEKEDLHIFIKRKQITYIEIDKILRQLIEKKLEDSSGEQELKELRELTNWFEGQEGFIELPLNIRKNLEEIKKHSPETEYLINLLAMSLKDIYRTYAAKAAGQRRLNNIYGIIGIVGVILTIIQALH
ncbi:hypothetical protein [Serratia ureilytica]|uniref:hypothetical protein n=1 Tax=Serratia ureilytica TaxID=300181 RepID=UPI0018D8843D|nr:hypothetical protein [Serratia ureilytica]MBH2647869.1 hypothetical protein [Serratia ureilytica]